MHMQGYVELLFKTNNCRLFTNICFGVFYQWAFTLPIVCPCLIWIMVPDKQEV